MAERHRYMNEFNQLYHSSAYTLKKWQIMIRRGLVWLFCRRVYGMNLLFIYHYPSTIQYRDQLYRFITKLYFGVRIMYKEINKVEILGHDVMRITLGRDSFRWKAEQHAFISAPSISSSPQESHPFSIVNVPTEQSNEAIFLIRVHSGFTRRLRNYLTSDECQGVPLYLEEPYGTPHSLDSHSAVLLLAGDTDVTFTLGHFLQILANTHQGESAVKRLHLVWHIRHAEEVEWISPLLNLTVEQRNEQANINIGVYVTKSHSSDEPLPSDGISNRLEAIVPRPQRSFGRGMGRHGLTTAAAELIVWRRGRADLNLVVKEDAQRSKDPMNVSVCGPVQLLQAAKKAVWEVSIMKAMVDGLVTIDFFEETLGA
ncbi:uncharacterized protein L203_101147 [Cryptococcus depauperatus CBS 7841]|uniref:ferric-chelate reductase (NADPH) n=1 Tax=Cryptococcus depauperatus CBS 7841 TaxID=1295531 RepID=A0AAJ8JPE5_9TREE